MKAYFIIFLLACAAVAAYAQNKTSEWDDESPCADPDDYKKYGCGFCNNSIECHSPRGACLDGQCVCKEKYGGDFCEDKRKNWLAALLLSILVGGTGADRFYLGYTGMGVGKLFLNFGFMISLCCIVVPVLTTIGGFSLCGAADIYESSKKWFGGCLAGWSIAVIVVVVGIGFATIFGALAWNIADVVKIALGVLPDVDGNALFFQGKVYYN